MRPVVKTSRATAVRPSSNWFQLQKSLTQSDNQERSRKRRKLHNATAEPSPGPSVLETPPKHNMKNGESLDLLKDMVQGKLAYTPKQQLRRPGRYLSLDCEMVGVGIDGAESSLARVSLVNYHGAVQLDVFVKQKERVVDYRTHVSGVRETDMINAKPFEQVQNRVAEILKERILVGHAVFNDLKALLLTHPRLQTRDTQHLAHIHKITSSRRPALRHLVEQELGLTIQNGEHSSITDARATMALYRLHRKEWEKGQRPIPPSEFNPRKRRRAEKDEELTGGAKDGQVHNPTQSSLMGTKRIGAKFVTAVERPKRDAKRCPGPRNREASAGRVIVKKWWKELGDGGKNI